jgi:hypothetical protein
MKKDLNLIDTHQRDESGFLFRRVYFSKVKNKVVSVEEIANYKQRSIKRTKEAQMIIPDKVLKINLKDPKFKILNLAYQKTIESNKSIFTNNKVLLRVEELKVPIADIIFFLGKGIRIGEVFMKHAFDKNDKNLESLNDKLMNRYYIHNIKDYGTIISDYKVIGIKSTNDIIEKNNKPLLIKGNNSIIFSTGEKNYQKVYKKN